ncbi:MAG TPA: dethiobiotin synthase, partial [Chromatiaceae bacterium]|nr:dethiobiotin synthase [Chromatiaceae bacterium]
MALDLPVLLVVGLRLGCINHALLTAEAIRARGACLIGWVANLVDPNMLAPDRNIATLSAEIDAPMLGSVPWLDRMEPNIIGAHLRVDSLVQQKPREA